jgi:para-nitrobenzyl esterase
MTNPIATTTSGPVRGSLDGEVFTFKGIPYGEAERFRAAEPAAPWRELRDCLAYGPTSVQPVRELPSISGPPPPQGEDCLVLNVWTRGLDDGGNRPIMFWIHGGGFSTGSGSSPLVDGASLCRRGDVVSISVNHRLGALGHLYLQGLDFDGKEQYRTSGINSFLDLILALEWVRDNARSFGGDPDNMMIFGESGGGGKVATLLTMPKARGLFKRAAIQSGIKCNNDRGVPTVFGKHGIEPDQADYFTRKVLANLGLTEQAAGKLLKLPAEEIANAQGAVERAKFVLGPAIDGGLMPRHPFDPDPAPTGADIPLLIGANGDEWFNYISARPNFKGIDWEGVIQWNVDWSLNRKTSERIVAAYRELHPDASPEDLLTTICSDHMIRVPSVRVADLRSAAGMAPVYHYSFTYDSPVSGKSVHALDIPFVFDNVDKTPLTGTGSERYPLAARMSDAWIAFARTGNPNHEGLPEWPAYDAEHRRTMVFDLETRVEADPFGAETRIWDGVI